MKFLVALSKQLYGNFSLVYNITYALTLKHETLYVSLVDVNILICYY